MAVTNVPADATKSRPAKWWGVVAIILTAQVSVLLILLVWLGGVAALAALPAVVAATAGLITAIGKLTRID